VVPNPHNSVDRRQGLRKHLAWFTTSVVVPALSALFVSAGVAYYSHQLTIDRSRVDGMVRLLDDIKQVNARIISFNTRPGEYSAMMPRRVSPPAIEIPPNDYRTIMGDIQATAIRFDLYYLSPESREAFASYSALVRGQQWDK
jgi:hypothetical protein